MVNGVVNVKITLGSFLIRRNKRILDSFTMKDRKGEKERERNCKYCDWEPSKVRSTKHLTGLSTKTNHNEVLVKMKFVESGLMILSTKKRGRRRTVIYRLLQSNKIPIITIAS